MLTSRQLTCGSILALISEHHADVGRTTAAQFDGPVRTGEGPEAVSHGQQLDRDTFSTKQFSCFAKGIIEVANTRYQVLKRSTTSLPQETAEGRAKRKFNSAECSVLSFGF
jgi:hypothetical protein